MMQHWRSRIGFAAILAVAAAAAVSSSRAAHAQPDSSLAVDGPPWARGVSAADRARARERHRIGTEHVLESRIPEAIASFREALRHWDHPGIHFNLAVAQEYLGQLLNAHESIENALRYDDHDPPPLSPAERARAISLRDKIRQRIVKIRIDCDEPAASVKIDGRQLLTGPGSRTQWVLPGLHQIVASKPRYMSASRSLLTQPGQTIYVELHLVPREQAEGTHRWAVWKPWAIVAAGMAAGAAGAILHQRSSAADRAFRDALARCPTGCSKDQLTAESASLPDKAMTLWYGAIAADAVGAVGVMTGIALLYANRLRPHRPMVHVLPLSSASTVGLGVTGTF